MLVIAGRYGSTDENGIGYTEKEYNYAVETKKVVLAFIHSDPGKLPVDKSDTDQAMKAKLGAFLDRVKKGRLVSFWNSREDLNAKVIISLSKAFSAYPGVGWIRGDAAASEDILAQLNQLRSENEKLKAENNQYQIPSLEGLSIAGLEDTYKVHFSYADRGDRHDASETLTWSELFTAIGPQYLNGSSSNFDDALGTYLQEKKIGTGYNLHVHETDLNVIRIHLAALGLITIPNDESNLIKLTGIGRQKLFELMTVPKGHT